MAKILKLPVQLENMIIKSCHRCPFYDEGDDGYGDHCNLLNLLDMDDDVVNPWVEDSEQPFFDGCPLDNQKE